MDTLWQSFANASTSAGEAEAVQAAIETAVFEGALGNVRASDEKWAYDYWWDDYEWVRSYWIQSIRIRDAAARGSARGMLSVAISFFRPEDRAGDGWIGGRRAKLYVGVAPTIKAWDATSLLVDGSGRSDLAEVRDRYRWSRIDTPTAWFFCVALDAIDSRETLTREVLQPLAALLRGEDEEAAFAMSVGILPP